MVATNQSRLCLRLVLRVDHCGFRRNRVGLSGEVVTQNDALDVLPHLERADRHRCGAVPEHGQVRTRVRTAITTGSTTPVSTALGCDKKSGTEK